MGERTARCVQGILTWDAESRMSSVANTSPEVLRARDPERQKNCVEIWCREVLPFSCSFWILRLGPLLVVKVGPRRAPKQAVGRGFTSVEAFDSDRAGGQLEITRAGV